MRLLCDNIFGENHFIACFIIDKTAQGANQSATFKTQHEFCLMYVNKKNDKINYDIEDKINITKYKYEDRISKYALTNGFDSINSPLSANKNRGYTIYYNEKNGDVEIRDEYNKETEKFFNYDKELLVQGYVPIRPGVRKGVQYPWNWMKERFLKQYRDELVFVKNKKGHWIIMHKNRATGKVKDSTIKKFDTRYYGNQLLTDIIGEKKFDYPKSLDMMSWVLKKHTDKSAIILDFFAGSGTTGQAVLELNKEDGGNRKFILVTNNENQIAEEVTYPRIKTVVTGTRIDGAKYSDGIPANLRYFKTDFVERERSTDATRQKLVDRSADMIRIREDAYEELNSASINKYYQSNDAFVAIIFDPFTIKEAWAEIESLNTEQKIVKLYIFSYSRDTSAFTDEIPKTNLKWEAVPIPESILQVYKRLFGGKK